MDYLCKYSLMWRLIKPQLEQKLNGHVVKTFLSSKKSIQLYVVITAVKQRSKEDERVCVCVTIKQVVMMTKMVKKRTMA